MAMKQRQTRPFQASTAPKTDIESFKSRLLAPQRTGRHLRMLNWHLRHKIEASRATQQRRWWKITRETHVFRLRHASILSFWWVDVRKKERTLHRVWVFTLCLTYPSWRNSIEHRPSSFDPRVCKDGRPKQEPISESSRTSFPRLCWMEFSYVFMAFKSKTSFQVTQMPSFLSTLNPFRPPAARRGHLHLLLGLYV